MILKSNFYKFLQNNLYHKSLNMNNEKFSNSEKNESKEKEIQPIFERSSTSLKKLNESNSGDLESSNFSKTLKKSTEQAFKKQKNLYTSYSKLSELKLVTIGLASPTKIKQWAEKRLPNGKIFGQVTNANTLHHKTFKPQKGGLFCERIFGPLKDFECACGKINKPTEEQKKQFLQFRNFERKFCPICDVEYTWSVIRRYQLGYIALVSPVTHIWYLKSTPSYLSILLDFKKRHLESIIYCSETLTLENSMKANYTFAMANSPLTLINSWKKIMGPPSNQFQLTNSENKDLNFFNLNSPNNAKFSVKSVSAINKDLLIPKRFSNWRNKSQSNVSLTKNGLFINDKQKNQSKFSFNVPKPTLYINGYDLEERNKKLENNFGVMNLNLSMNEFQSQEEINSISSVLSNKLNIANQYSQLSKNKKISDQTLNFVEANYGNAEKQNLQNIPLYISTRAQKISDNLAFFLTLNQVTRLIYKLSYKTANQQSKKVLIKTVMELQKQNFYKKSFDKQNAKERNFGSASSVENIQKWIQLNLLVRENQSKKRTDKQAPLDKTYTVNDDLHTNSQLSIFKIQKTLESQFAINNQSKNLVVTAKEEINQTSTSKLEKKFFYLIKTYALSILLELLSEISSDVEKAPSFGLNFVKKQANLTINAQSSIKVKKFVSQIAQQLKPFLKLLNKIFFKNVMNSKFTQIFDSLVNDSINNFSPSLNNYNEMTQKILKLTSNTQNSETTNDANFSSKEFIFSQTQKSEQMDQTQIFPILVQKNLNKSDSMFVTKNNSNEIDEKTLRERIDERTSQERIDERTSRARIEIKLKKERLLKEKVIPNLSTTSKTMLLDGLTNVSKNLTKEISTTNLMRKEDVLTEQNIYGLNNLTISLLLPKSGENVSGMNNGSQEPREFSLPFQNFSNKNSANQSKTPIFNNIYSLSHRYRWEIEKDWHSFLFYMSAPEDLNDFPILTYENRISPINSMPISGASIIQKLLMEFNFTELRKMDKQNRILLYDFQKMLNQFRRLAKKGYLDRFDKKDFRELLKKRDNLMRRTKLIRKLFRKNSRADWMILSVLPVLPPELRPIIKIQDQVAASDLNRLYQRILYRNERLKKFLKDPSTSYSYEMKYAQRLLQEAVDNLIENGKSGTTPERDSRGRNLKSLSEILKGKQGRFRQHLLGKRVDYSGRSVIVVSPTLKIHECGLPKEMALELFLPFLIKRILHFKFAKTVIGAKTFMRTNKDITLEILREILQGHPILLNRAPTLHRLGIQAFQPKLIDGRAILLHPLVCSAFNADFDGDQMAVHVPITVEARSEAWKLMFARNHLLSPATGEPMILPSQDMVLGCYYLTSENFQLFKYKILKQMHTFSRKVALEGQKAELLQIPSNRETILPEHFSNPDQILQLYNQGKISVQLPIWLRWMNEFETESGTQQPLEIRLDHFGNRIEIFPKYFRQTNIKGMLINQFIRTTAGRMLLYTIIESLKKTN